MDQTDQDALLQAEAEAAMARAHAPYSGLKVGAALRTAGGTIHSGCNVESAAFPIGGCAEHHAIAAAVRAEGGGVRIEAILIVARDAAGQAPPIPPCGACRQLISEFGPQAQVLFRGRSGALETHSIAELLPHSFQLGGGDR